MNQEDRALIARSLRSRGPVERWGPYCTVPPIYDKAGNIEYVHMVYPVARGYIRNDDGTTRPATPEELELLSRAFDAHLELSFTGMGE